MSAAEAAKVIRERIKRELGATSRQVSVRASSYSMGSSIHVKVRDAGIRLMSVEHVDRCEATGEILNGGNR